MATIYDSTAAGDIPNADHGYVFAYNDGIYSQVAAVRARFPGARIVTISAVGQASADVVDVEPGCVWPPASAVAYVQRERANGRWPTVYCGRANWPLVVQAFAQAGMAQPPYWVAHYTNTPHLCSSGCFPSSVGSLVAKATQYGGDLPGHFDITVTNGSWPDDVHAEGSGTQLNPADMGGALSEEDFMSALTEDEQRRILAFVDRNGDLRDGTFTRLDSTVTPLLLSLTAAVSEQQAFRIYMDVDDGGKCWLLAPGIEWHIPNEDYLALLIHYRLAGQPIGVNGSDVMGFIKMMYAQLTASASNQDVIDALQNLDLSKAVIPKVDLASLDIPSPQAIAQAVADEQAKRMVA